MNTRASDKVAADIKANETVIPGRKPGKAVVWWDRAWKMTSGGRNGWIRRFYKRSNCWMTDGRLRQVHREQDISAISDILPKGHGSRRVFTEEKNEIKMEERNAHGIVSRNSIGM